MSKPRYRWWGYVKGMVRDYPRYQKLLFEKQEPRLTPRLTGLPTGKGKTSDTVYTLATATLSPVAQKEYEAVDLAIRQVKNPNILVLIKLVYWDQTHTVIGAGYALHYEAAQAKRLHGEFLKSVAKNFGLL